MRPGICTIYWCMSIQTIHQNSITIQPTSITYKDSVDNLKHLLPAVERMHGELQGHVEAMHGDPKKQAEAIRLRNALKKTEAWANVHGEDAPGLTMNDKRVLLTYRPIEHIPSIAGRSSTRGPMSAGEASKGETAGAKEKLIDSIWGSSSQQRQWVGRCIERTANGTNANAATAGRTEGVR